MFLANPDLTLNFLLGLPFRVREKEVLDELTKKPRRLDIVM